MIVLLSVEYGKEKEHTFTLARLVWELGERPTAVRNGSKRSVFAISINGPYRIDILAKTTRNSG
jgi:hypothetical protein